jgi:hypothetical protein
MAEVNLGGFVNMGTLQNLAQALTIPTAAVGPIAKNIPEGVAATISEPIHRWAALLEQHVGEVQSEPKASVDAVKDAALTLAATTEPSVGAMQQLDAQILRAYADAARAFLQAVEPILRELESNPNLLQKTLESGVGTVVDALSPSLQGVQNIYAESVRSFAQALKLVAGVAPAAAAALTNAVAPGTAVAPEKINIG